MIGPGEPSEFADERARGALGIGVELEGVVSALGGDLDHGDGAPGGGAVDGGARDAGRVFGADARFAGEGVDRVDLCGLEALGDGGEPGLGHAVPGFGPEQAVGFDGIAGGPEGGIERALIGGINGEEHGVVDGAFFGEVEGRDAPAERREQNEEPEEREALDERRGSSSWCGLGRRHRGSVSAHADGVLARGREGGGARLFLNPMDISLHWMNSYLEPGDVSAQEADDLLTQAGLPIEGHTPLKGGDVLLDVEVTSNRPDCLSHLGCAREVAALSGRRLKYPEPGEVPTAGTVGDLLTLENREHGGCPLFTARVITGCKVGPSPSWLVERLEAIGQRSINNAVDITNFITHEFGNPCHVFDRAKLAGHALVVRHAEDGEKLTTLDGKVRTLRASDLVVADSARVQSLAGVMGGADSEVDEGTTEIVFEMATWDPVTVRTQARRLAINTDAGFRFQRGIDARTIADAAARAVALLVELTGGTLAEGELREGAALPSAQFVALRPSQVRRMLGISVPAGDIIAMLRSVEIGVEQLGEDELKCEIPPHRSRDLPREIDLIEEVARIKGYAAIPTDDALSVSITPPQADRLAVRELGRVLTGLGFDETVTFSFANPKKAAFFQPVGVDLAAVDEARRPDEPTLRPSPLTGLLGCRQANQAARSAAPGTVRLFEIAAAFGQEPAAGQGATKPGLPPRSIETRNLSLVMDVPGSADSVKRKFDDKQAGLRAMRGVIDTLVRAMHGTRASVEVVPLDKAADAKVCPAWDPAATGVVRINPAEGDAIELGCFGLIAPAAQQAFGLDVPVIAAELNMAALVCAYPPRSLAHPLPSFPHIDRDLSLIVDEGTRWSAIDAIVAGQSLDRLEACSFVGVFRGEQIGAGKKSVTLRLRFRDGDRTLRHDEVDPQVETVVTQAKNTLGAEIRV